MALLYATAVSTNAAGIEDSEYRHVRALFDDSQMVELTLSVCFFNYFTRIANAFNLPVESWSMAFAATPPEHVYVQPAPPPPVVVEVAPTPPARVYVERMAPPPPPPVYAPACPDHCPMSDNHDGWRDHHADAEAPPAYERREYAQTAPPPAYSRHEEHYGYINQPPAQVYERREEHYGYVNPPPAGYAEREARESFERDHGYAYERRETEQSSGWRYSDGHDGYAERYEDRRGPCPPSPDHGCSAASGDGYGAVYQYSGRDAYGFLVWPGKADGQ